MSATMDEPDIKNKYKCSILFPTPWSIDYIKPELLIYSRSNAQNGLQIPYDMLSHELAELLDVNNYLTTNRVVFVTHGFRNNIKSDWMNRIKDELLKESDQTVVLVGWGGGADLIAPKYLQAGANIQSVAKWLSNHLVEISKRNSQVPLWGIGHSLGAHLMGMSGRLSGVLSRISGLDPAGPAFEKHEFLTNRLCESDGIEMVDVIHTDGYDSFLDPEDWISPVNHYGTLIPLGTLDFYPNFGYNQPGAGPVSSFTIAGSHLRAIDLYIYSINNQDAFSTNSQLDGTPAFETPVKSTKKSEICAEMGYHAHKKLAQRGLYYLKTTKSEPWVDQSTKNENLCRESEKINEKCEELSGKVEKNRGEISEKCKSSKENNEKCQNDDEKECSSSFFGNCSLV